MPDLMSVDMPDLTSVDMPDLATLCKTNSANAHTTRSAHVVQVTCEDRPESDANHFDLHLVADFDGASKHAGEADEARVSPRGPFTVVGKHLGDKSERFL